MTTQARAKADGSPVPDMVEKIPALRPSTTEVVAYDAAAATTVAFGSDVTVLRIMSNTDCHYKLGSAPTATTSDVPLPANVVEYVAIIPGVDKISFIKQAASSAGNAWVSQCGGAA